MPTKAEQLADLYAEAERSIKKTLNTPARFVRGAGFVDAKVLFIGEAPGLEEDRTGTPFVGRAGQVLNAALASIGLAREHVYISNIVKCHPMKNPATPDARGNDRPPTPMEIALGWPVLQKEIDIIQPKILMPLGTPAAQAILQTKEPIGKLRGKVVPCPWNPRLRVLATYHPSAVLHNPVPKIKEAIAADFKQLKRLLDQVQI